MVLAWSVAYHGYSEGEREHGRQAGACCELLGGNNWGRLVFDGGSEAGQALPLSVSACQQVVRGLYDWHLEQVRQCRAGAERVLGLLRQNGLRLLSVEECQSYKQNVPAGAKAVRSCVELSSVGLGGCAPSPLLGVQKRERERGLFEGLE